MKFNCKKFKDLTTSELYALLKLRSAVFVVEQNCAYQDLDDLDVNAYHVYLVEENELIACSRILPPGLQYPEPAIGRVVVDLKFRKKDIGKELMKYCIAKTIELFECQSIVISAQKYLLKFYATLGFVSIGEEYLEDGIPHIKMKYSLRNK